MFKWYYYDFLKFSIPYDFQKISIAAPSRYKAVHELGQHGYNTSMPPLISSRIIFLKKNLAVHLSVAK